MSVQIVSIEPVLSSETYYISIATHLCFVTEIINEPNNDCLHKEEI